LATWRLSSLLVHEDGPWNLLVKFRDLVGVDYDTFNEAYGKNVLAEMLTCVWCTSPWMAALLYAASHLWPEVLTWVMFPLALSTLAIIVERIVE